MKRGNTALKRVVSVASVAAMAIAGAVLAAPAASADPAAADAIRATPTADANWVNSDGSASTSYVGNGPYSAGTPTGETVVVRANANQQQVSGFQVVIPATRTAGTLTVALPAGVTFAAPPSVDVDYTNRILASFNNSAGFAGANAHEATAVAAGTAVALPAGSVGNPTLSSGNNHVDISVGANTATTGGYLLTFRNVLVNSTGLATTTPIVATLTDTAVTAPVSGTTTLGYATTIAISAATSTVEADGNAATNNVSLPDIVVKENGAGSFGATPATVTLTIAGGTVDTASTPKATISGDARTVAVGTLLATSVSVTVTGAATAADTVTVSGIKLTGVAKNAKVTISVTAPATAGTASNSAAAGFSFVKSLSGVFTEVSTTAPEPRIAGASRYETAAKIMDTGITAGIWTAGTTNSVVIANGETVKQGVDALSANYLAAAKNAPILLTEANSLPLATQSALIKLFKGYTAGDINVYVLGKTDAVSDNVRNQIKSIVTSTAGTLPTGKAVNIVKVEGDNRYQTSAAAATEGGDGSLQLHSLSTSTAWYRTAFLASGKVNADALAAGSASVSAGIPVLLADGDALDAKVSDAIKNLGIKQVVVLGGTDRVSDKLVASLADLGVTNTTRVAGADRYATAAALYTWAFAPVNPSGSTTSRGLGWATAAGTAAYLANGTAGFPDALAVGPLAGNQTDPILTVQTDKLGDGATKLLKDNKSHFTAGVWALGQQDRISSDVITAAQDALK